MIFLCLEISLIVNISCLIILPSPFLTWTYHTLNDTQTTTNFNHSNNTHSLDCTQLPNLPQQTHEPESLPTQTSNENSQTQITTPTTEIHHDNHIRPTRDIYTPSYLHDYVCNSSASHKESSPSGIPYPIASFHSFDNLSPSQK